MSRMERLHPPEAPATGSLRSLRHYNYRLWFGGALVSNIGTWMQRAAQDWLVLTELTHNDARAVGIVMGLQFGPQFLLMPWTGAAADHMDRRRLLMITQAAMGLLALALGIMTVTGSVRLWQVYAFAAVFGAASAFDAPVRQTFVGDLVGEGDLSNAVALNSTIFNGARMVGPVVAGLAIGAVGTGWAFVANGVSFLAVLASLAMLRRDQLHGDARPLRKRGSLFEGFRYVAGRPDLRAISWMLFLIGTFGLNFPIFISTMAVSAFHQNAAGYGLLSSAMAVGSVVAGVLSSRRARPDFGILTASAAGFGITCALAALAPSFWTFGAMLVAVGMTALTFTNSTNSLMQLTSDPAMRGRVMAIRLAIALGCTPLGAPLVGWVANAWGPRWALGMAALSGFLAMLVGLRHGRRVSLP
ncbi:MAG TPA: MFS transporter [Novosphingobium sp.]|nr:MFS transporter [Novosphingobium sp.]